MILEKTKYFQFFMVQVATWESNNLSSPLSSLPVLPAAEPAMSDDTLSCNGLSEDKVTDPITDSNLGSGETQ